MKKIILIFLVFTSLSAVSQVNRSLLASSISEEEKEALLQSGLSEEEILDRLESEGYDFQNIEMLDQAELKKRVSFYIEEAQKQNQNAEIKVDSVIDEKISEANQEVQDQIQSNIDNGSTLEESINEVITEKSTEKIKIANIFGHAVFNKSVDIFRTTKPAQTPKNYILNSGDEISINIFGVSQADFTFTIEEDGFIRPKGLNKIYLKGLPFYKGRELLIKRFKQSYAFTNGQFNVNLNTARTISINIFGEVNNPGTFTVSALNTALTALISAGGIKENGSVREIQVFQNGKMKVLDVYKILSSPIDEFDYYLSNNDIIYVPLSKKIVTIENGTKRKGRFELKPDENFKSLLKYAGGLNAETNNDEVNISRYTQNQRELLTYDFEKLKQNPSFILKDGDIISFRLKSNRENNYVEIIGESVLYPGRYELSNGMKISNLLALAQIDSLTFNFDFGILTRNNLDGTTNLSAISFRDIERSDLGNFDLKLFDKIEVFENKDFEDSYTFTISGAVRAPGEKPWSQDSTLSLKDAIFMSKGLTDNAYNFGYVIGKNFKNSKEVNYKTFDISKAIKNPNSNDNFLIQRGDQIFIPKNEDFEDVFSVSTLGEFRNPQTFSISKDLDLIDVVSFSGGIKYEGDPKKIEVVRLDKNPTDDILTKTFVFELDETYKPLLPGKKFELKPYDLIIARKNPNIDTIRYVELKGLFKYPGIYPIVDRKSTVLDVIKAAGGIEIDADPHAAKFIRDGEQISFDFTTLFSKKKNKPKRKSKYNIELSDRDILILPKSKNVARIRLTGTNAAEDLMKNEIALALSKVERSRKLINQYAGGFSKSANKSSVRIIENAGSSVKRTKNFVLFRVFPKVSPGDVVLVYLENENENENSVDKIQSKSKDITDKLTKLAATINVLVGTLSATITSIVLAEKL